MVDDLETRVLAMRWFYKFILPGGGETAGYGPQQLHEDRLDMALQAIRTHCGDDFTGLTATDIACHQGWFAHHFAKRGMRSVTGVDARPEHVAAAELMRDACGQDNLRFVNHDIFDPAVKALPQTDIVLLYGLLYHLEDPIGAIRIASGLTKRLLLIETQVLNTELTGLIDWGSYQSQIALQGSFGLIHEPDPHNLETGVSGLALVPGAGVLLWLLRQFGFTSVAVIPPAAGAHEQLLSGKRIVIAAAR